MKYLFSETEFMTLSMLSGHMNIYTFAPTHVPSDEQYLHALHDLYEREFLTRSGDQFLLSPVMKHAFTVIGCAKRAILFEAADSLPQQIIYPDDSGQIWILERRKNEIEDLEALGSDDEKEYVQDFLISDVMSALPPVVKGDNPDEDRMFTIQEGASDEKKCVFSFSLVDTSSARVINTLRLLTDASSAEIESTEFGKEKVCDKYIYSRIRFQVFLLDLFNRSRQERSLS